MITICYKMGLAVAVLQFRLPANLALVSWPHEVVNLHIPVCRLELNIVSDITASLAHMTYDIDAKKPRKFPGQRHLCFYTMEQVDCVNWD